MHDGCFRPLLPQWPLDRNLASDHAMHPQKQGSLHSPLLEPRNAHRHDPMLAHRRNPMQNEAEGQRRQHRGCPFGDGGIAQSAMTAGQARANQSQRRRQLQVRSTHTEHHRTKGSQVKARAQAPRGCWEVKANPLAVIGWRGHHSSSRSGRTRIVINVLLTTPGNFLMVVSIVRA